MDDRLKSALHNALECAIPQTLDDIIRNNRDRAGIGLATEAELSAIPQDVGTRLPTDIIEGWHLISLRERATDGTGTVSIHLLGWSRTRAVSWITSPVVALDRCRNQARTRSGTRYELGDPGHGEPDLELRLHVCRALRAWGLGSALGVLEVI